MALVLAALAAGADEWKRWADSLASDGEAEFLSVERAAQVPLCLLAAAALPWLALLARRGGARSPAPTDRGWLLELALVAGFAMFGAARIARVDPMTKDTKFYLDTALDIDAKGGVGALPGRCFRGEYAEDNRHPLYLAAISTVAAPSQAFVDRARAISLAGAVATLAAFLLLVRRKLGREAALLGAALLATNSTFVGQATTVACESWLAFFAVLWFHSSTASVRGGALAGAWAGLAWLAKGTGTWFLFVHAFEGALDLVRGRGRSLRERGKGLLPLGAVALAFSAVALPLLVRNARIHGNPLYNLNSSRLMWLDRWEEFFEPAKVEAASPGHWLATHSLLDAAKRLAGGGAQQAWHALDVFAPIGAPTALALPIAFLAALALRSVERRDARRLALLFGLAFASLAWYAQIASDPRFLGALIPLWILPIGALASGIAPASVRARAIRCGGGIAAIALIVASAMPRPERAAPSGTACAAVRSWLLDGIERNDRVEFLAPRELGCDWTKEVRPTRRAMPESASALEELIGSTAGARVRYAIAHPGEPAVAAWVRIEPDGSLGVAKPLPGWTAVIRLPIERPEVIVFRRE